MTYIFRNEDPRDTEKILDLAKTSFSNFGIAIFPGLFTKTNHFNEYINDLHWMFDYVFRKNQLKVNRLDLGDRLNELNNSNPLDGKIITDIGTQPNKFSSFCNIKYSSLISKLTKSILNEDESLHAGTNPIVTPQSGDTLHFFAPGEKFFKYNLPNHQDFPYLMQSQRQLTCYLGLSDYQEGVGGLGFYLGSNSLGVVKHHKNTNGSFEISDQEILEPFKYEEFYWNPGDFAIFDSLLIHRSIPNITSKHGRLVQIFRFSGLSKSTQSPYHFQSTAYPKRSVNFEEFYPDLYATP